MDMALKVNSQSSAQIHSDGRNARVRRVACDGEAVARADGGDEDLRPQSELRNKII